MSDDIEGRSGIREKYVTEMQKAIEKSRDKQFGDMSTQKREAMESKIKDPIVEIAQKISTEEFEQKYSVHAYEIWKIAIELLLKAEKKLRLDEVLVDANSDEQKVNGRDFIRLNYIMGLINMLKEENLPFGFFSDLARETREKLISEVEDKVKQDKGETTERKRRVRDPRVKLAQIIYSPEIQEEQSANLSTVWQVAREVLLSGESQLDEDSIFSQIVINGREVENKEPVKLKYLYNIIQKLGSKKLPFRFFTKMYSEIAQDQIDNEYKRNYLEGR